MFIPIIIVVLIIVLCSVGKNKHTKPSVEESEIDVVRGEILKELAKAEPDYERIKDLKKWENRLNIREDGEITHQAQTVSNADGSSNGAITVDANKAKSLLNTPVKITGLDAALYAGSLLILAGVGGLVWSGLDSLGLILLIIATLIFYIGGIVIRNNETFKRVSLVFVGTGMAMLPFIGVLLYNITKINPEIIWLLLSLVGVPVYFFATYMMKNQVFAYFAMAGLISLSCSMPSAMNLGLMWYFVFVMILGVILDVIAKTNISKKLGVLSDAIKITGEWLPLMALVTTGTVFYQLSANDFGILFSIIIIQLTLNLWRESSLIWETLLRIAIFITIILLSYIIMPNNFAVGIGTIIAASLEFGYSLISTKTSKKDASINDRIAIETGWIIVILFSYPMACFYIMNFTSSIEFWYYMLIALITDIAIIIGSSFLFKTRGWFFGLLPVGVFLPIVISYILDLPTWNSPFFFIPFYLVEMCLMAGSSWLMKDDKKGDSMTITSTIVFGLLCLIASPNVMIGAGIMLLVALILGARGWDRKNNTLLETAVYALTVSIMMAIFNTMRNTISGSFFNQIVWVIMGHIGFTSLATTSQLWDDKQNRKRLIIGVIALLVLLGGSALGGTTWIMTLFMAEAAMVLILGVISRQQAVWISGAIALCVAVLWFTKDLYFVWPVLLGIGLIGTVVGIIIYNDKKNKLKQ